MLLKITGKILLDHNTMYCITVLPFTQLLFTVYTIMVTIYRVNDHCHCSLLLFLYHPSNLGNVYID